MSHKLAVEIPYITNPKVMRVYDSSVWDSEVLSSEIKLSITPAGFVYPTEFIVKRGFDRLFNVSNLGIHTVDDLTDLPDGIFIIRLSNSNGDCSDCSQWVEYNHLRQVQLLNSWYSALCKLNLSDCTDITKDVEKERQKLYQIKMYIDAAKAKVEYCKSPNEGLALHNYAKKLLDKFNSSCNNC
jgi:hypothetical protein